MPEKTELAKGAGSENVAFDKDGFLKDSECWNENLALDLAELEGITLTDAHWEILQLLRAFYTQYQQVPPMRVFVRYVAQQRDKDKGNSLYLMKLFPDAPLRRAARIAGLPKPSQCL